MKTNGATDARVAALREAPLDAWIALSGDETRIVARGATYDEVAAQLEKAGDESSVILKTPPQWAMLSV